MKMWRRLKKGPKIVIIVLAFLLLIGLVFVGYKVCSKWLLTSEEVKTEEVKKEEFDSEKYKYYINSSASKYEKELFEELKKVLSKEEVVEEDYASALAKMFIGDLLTLSSKNSSSDITSSQYVYDDYIETFKLMVKDTIYASIELNLDGKREQSLPTVNNVEVVSVNRGSYSFNGQEIDSQAYFITTNIGYEKDLGYPASYEIVLVRHNELLKVVRAKQK